MGISPYGGPVGYIIWGTWSGLIDPGVRDMVARGSGGGVSPSMGALRREPGWWLPCWGTLGVGRKDSGDGISLNRGSDWGTWRRAHIPGL
jgi:hypothetical protein